jgi:hypothetical protein
VLERSTGSQIRAYLERKAAFNRHRRKVKADFDKLYRLFESDLSFKKIAEVAGVSKPRIVEIFRLHFAQFFSVSGSKRRRDIAKRRKDEVANRVARLISKDPVLNAIKASAARAKRKRTIEPIILNRRGPPPKRYRHKAVLVDGRHVESVHHISTAQVYPGGGLAYGTTSLFRRRLENSSWSIFVIDVPKYRRRVIRCKNLQLLKALFAGNEERRSAYIPLNGRPENPRYDFLADEDNWQ